MVGSGRVASAGDRCSVLGTGRVDLRTDSAALLLEIDDKSKATEDGVWEVSIALAGTGRRARRRRGSVEPVELTLPMDILSVVAADTGSPLV